MALWGSALITMWCSHKWLRRLGWRGDFGLRRTIINCVLMGVLLGAGMVFFSCRQRLLVRPTPQIDTESRFLVRVLLADDITTCTVNVRGNFNLLNSDGSVLIPETMFIEQGLPMEVTVSGATLTLAGRHFSTNRLTILPDSPYIFSFGGDQYRGKLLLKVNPDGTSFDAVNIVPLEPYLAGVVGAEMPDYWEPEALKAQAIAARTYCLYNKKNFGVNRDWDVTKTAANQVYLGLKAESQRVWNAVNETSGQVLVCTQAGGVENIFPAYYSSACGGHTEDSKNVFGDSFGPLCGVVCPYCKDVAKPNIFFWPMAQFDNVVVETALQRKYPKLRDLGDITNIAPARQTDYPDFSRLTMAKIVGSTGRSEFVRAEDLRLTIDPTGFKIRSTICRIVAINGKWAFLAGRGFGHGVGLCQCGAEGMARKGNTFAEILSYYYPGSRVRKLY